MPLSGAAEGVGVGLSSPRWEGPGEGAQVLGQWPLAKWVLFPCLLLRAVALLPGQLGEAGSYVGSLWGALVLPLAPPGALFCLVTAELSSLFITELIGGHRVWPRCELAQRLWGSLHMGWGSARSLTDLDVTECLKCF